MRSTVRSVAAIAAGIAGILALVLAFVVAPAGADDNHHPSGNDRTVEPGGSGTQGHSESEPDRNGTGPERNWDEDTSPDKVAGTGGDHDGDFDDQDDNNGCGNDDDFEDDNEGWCGKPSEVEENGPTVADTTTTTTTTVVEEEEEEEEEVAATTTTTVVGEEQEAEQEVAAGAEVRPPEVLSSEVEREAVAAPEAEAVPEAEAQPAPQVLGESIERQPQAAPAEVTRGQLAFTGLRDWLLVAAGVALLLGGTLIGLRDRFATKTA